MKLKELRLHAFKNHRDLHLHMDCVAFGVHGLNGKGKTNVLDAIHLLCVGRSYFASTDGQCIQHEQDEMGVVGQFEKEGEEVELKLRMRRGGRKHLERNGKHIPRLIDHLGQFLVVVIAPGDISLVYGNNSDRRAFLDRMLSQTDPHYAQGMLRYKRLIEQRNACLRSEFPDQALLDSLDEQLHPLAHQIHEARKAFLDIYVPVVDEYYAQLSDRREEVSLGYSSQLAEGEYSELSARERQKDLILKRSTVGIHKDEIDLQIDGENLKRFGSQGQIKSYLIALKLAEFSYYHESSGDMPLLLLDDIFEKIDEERAVALTRIIKSGTFGQIFITDTQQERLEDFCRSIDDHYKLKAL